MYSTEKKNYLIVDTCTLLHCSELMAKLLQSIHQKNLNFVMVIPTIVVVELKRQIDWCQSRRVDTYTSWIRHASCISETTTLGRQAGHVVEFLEKSIDAEIPHLRYQGHHQTVNYPVYVCYLLIYVVFCTCCLFERLTISVRLPMICSWIAYCIITRNTMVMPR
ncbi:hypothetical protein BGW37DRAFT_471535 [Umbelopsis sp. PMI_123]|nr:hypothetical protein BGW37DRAFT_471535 [Umbelopsis sp. PMI_123]